MAGVLLYILATFIGFASIAAFAYGSRPEPSALGMGITVAALVVMPLLVWLKRKAAHAVDSCTLAADAVQSATCAYLAALTLLDLAMTALFHLRCSNGCCTGIDC